MSYDLITILGPTATGKTKLAVQLCHVLHGEIISADSRQVYKRMDLGTGKDLSDYRIDNKIIPYHLIDILEPGEKYNVFRFKKDFYSAYGDIKNRGKIPVLCGGSGMYIESILRNYNLIEVPENKELRNQLESYSLKELTEKLKTYKNIHNKTDVDTKKRAIRAIEIEEYEGQHRNSAEKYSIVSSLNIGVNIDRELRRKKISERLKLRIEQGMLDEVRQLLDAGIKAEDLIYYGLEYKYITEYILGKYSYDEFFIKLETAIHQFAKRQMTYFRGMERRGVRIHWLDAANSLQENVNQIINKTNS
jgi:tRNA dimethylallyltransferase